MAVTAGFQCGEWVSEFQINQRGKSIDPYHVVLPAKKNGDCARQKKHKNEIITKCMTCPLLNKNLHNLRFEVENLKHRPQIYEQNRVNRAPHWIYK